MTTTKEQRIYKHYQSKRHWGKQACSFQDFGHYSNDDNLILFLAKHWKMKCKEIKDIVRAFQKENKYNDKIKRFDQIYLKNKRKS